MQKVKVKRVKVNLKDPNLVNFVAGLDMETVARMPDTAKVKNHLLRYGKITSMQAFELYGITRLADVIYKLRKKDDTIKIETQLVYGRDRYGDPVQYGVYYLD